MVSVLSAHGERFRNRRRASRAEGREIRQVPRRSRRKGVVARKLVDEIVPDALALPERPLGVRQARLGAPRPGQLGNFHRVHHGQALSERARTNHELFFNNTTPKSSSSSNAVVERASRSARLSPESARRHGSHRELAQSHAVRHRGRSATLRR